MMTLEKAFDMAKTYPVSEQQKVINYVMSIKIDKPKEEPKKDTSMRIGAGKGKFNLPDDFDDYNEEIYAEIERYALS